MGANGEREGTERDSAVAAIFRVTSGICRSTHTTMMWLYENLLQVQNSDFFVPIVGHELFTDELCRLQMLVAAGNEQAGSDGHIPDFATRRKAEFVPIYTASEEEFNKVRGQRYRPLHRRSFHVPFVFRCTTILEINGPAHTQKNRSEATLALVRKSWQPSLMRRFRKGSGSFSTKMKSTAKISRRGISCIKRNGSLGW